MTSTQEALHWNRSHYDRYKIGDFLFLQVFRYMMFAGFQSWPRVISDCLSAVSLDIP